MKILTPNHKHLDFSWARLPASARSTLAMIAAAVAVSSVSAICALLLFTKAANAADHSAVSTTQAVKLA